MNELDRWWCNLTTERKNRIASKVGGCNVGYPACTSVWLGLSDERKQAIHDHCTDKHGYFCRNVARGLVDVILKKRADSHKPALFELLIKKFFSNAKIVNLFEL